MKNLYWIAVVGAAGILSAQTPDFSGVWKANAEKSKGLPPQASLVTVIEQKDGRLSQTVGVFGQREQRMRYNWDLSGKEGRGTLGGLPLKSVAKWEGPALLVDVTQPNNRHMNARYALSDDGKTLNIEMKVSGSREMVQSLVLDKGTDADAEMLKKPEQTADASGRYKSLKLLGGAPASSIGDTMQAFAFALGKECTFCHVQGNFAAEDKPEKATARKMIEMVTAINKNHFGDRPQVRCFTCHQGSGHPPAAKF